jgi:hypothetical protein
MNDKFVAEIQKAKDLHYNKKLAGRLLDDLGTAFISSVEHGSLDKSLNAVKSTRHTLAREGYSQAEIDDYLLEHSYLSKTRISKLRTQSIFIDESVNIIPIIDNRGTKFNMTDRLIDTIQSKPDLLKALSKGMRADNIQRKFKISHTTQLINFYNANKDII